MPVGAFRIAMPSSGAKITATNQETISAMPTTAKIEKVYSPAEERAPMVFLGADWFRSNGIAAVVERMLRGCGLRLYHLGLTKSGAPRHPLYLKRSLKLNLWD